MRLTEQQKEIAKECFERYLKHAPSVSAEAMFDLFLSRLREKQEAVATVIVYNDTVSISASAGMLSKLKEMNGLALFTIPPAAPDCKELVEALEMVVEYFKPHGTGRVFYLGYPSDKRKNEFLYEALAKHKASMGEKE